MRRQPRRYSNLCALAISAMKNDYYGTPFYRWGVLGTRLSSKQLSSLSSNASATFNYTWIETLRSTSSYAGCDRFISRSTRKTRAKNLTARSVIHMIQVSKSSESELQSLKNNGTEMSSKRDNYRKNLKTTAKPLLSSILPISGYAEQSKSFQC